VAGIHSRAVAPRCVVPARYGKNDSTVVKPRFRCPAFRKRIRVEGSERKDFVVESGFSVNPSEMERTKAEGKICPPAGKMWPNDFCAGYRVRCISICFNSVACLCSNLFKVD
jgi:hypothetical protein